VTATTRSATRAQPLYTTFPKYVNTVKFISVPDFTIPGAFDGAFKAAVEPFSYVLHTASPIPLQTTDVKKDLIDPAIEGTLGMLKAAKEFGGDSLKRIVITGSGVSMIDPFRAKDDPRAEPLTEKDWNPVCFLHLYSSLLYASNYQNLNSKV
jgi:nucleoside-diphosphate-sugar epimerase